MSTDLRSLLNVELGWTWRDRSGAFLVADSNRLQFAKELADGSGIEQADGVWHAADQSLADGASLVLRLGALARSLFGDTMTVALAKVKALVVVNKTTIGDAALIVGAAGTEEWSAPFGAQGDTVKAMRGSPLVLAHLRDGWPVTSPNDALKLAATGGDVLFDLAILGVRA